MKLPLASIALSSVAALASGPAQAQGLPAHTYAVVTTDGFFVPNVTSSVPLVFAPPSDFGGALTLSHPAVEWERASGQFLVVSGAHLYRVRIDLSTGNHQVQDLTPASAQPLDLYDLDVHPATGELFVLDQSTDSVLRFAPPLALGMLPDLALPVSGTARTMAVDSRTWPLAVLVGDGTSVERIAVDGSSKTLFALPFTSGVDQDPQTPLAGGAFACEVANDKVVRATSNPALAISLNYFGFCTPFAITPRDVEWSPIDHRAYVLAEDGINGASMGCSTLASGKNHIVEFPLAQNPVVHPVVITNAAASGITGLSGDLAFVQEDFGFVSPYGDGCAGGSPTSMTIDVEAFDIPLASGSTLHLNVAGAPAGMPTYLLVGYSKIDALLPLGCHVYTSAELSLSMGLTSAQGKASLTLPSPALPVGTEVYLQAATMNGSGGPALSHGLRVHFAL
jgi:hypothetical protein